MSQTFNNARVPTLLEIYQAFPFQKNDITVPSRRPSSEVTRKLKKGIERNAKYTESDRPGCEGMGHRWLCISPTTWTTEQGAIMDERFATDLAVYNAARDAWIAAAAGRTAAAYALANPIPLRTDAEYNAL